MYRNERPYDTYLRYYNIAHSDYGVPSGAMFDEIDERQPHGRERKVAASLGVVDGRAGRRALTRTELEAEVAKRVNVATVSSR